MNGVPLNPFANLETYTTMKVTCSRILIIVVTSSDCSGILSLSLYSMFVLNIYKSEKKGEENKAFI